MEPFIYDEATVSIQWPKWLFRFENYLALSEIDIAQLAGAATALRHLLHSGGPKIMDIYEAQDNHALTYAQVRTMFNTRFAAPANRLRTFTFRNCKQGQEESLDDYIIKLQQLAINAGVPAADRDGEIINIIAQHTNSIEIQQKALQEDITLLQLRNWNIAQQTVARCSKLINSAKAESINAVKQGTPRQCFNCGKDFPHPLGFKCPAIGKECYHCHKLDHFSKVCMRENRNRPSTPNNEQNQREASPYNQRRDRNDRRESSPYSQNRDSNRNRSSQGHKRLIRQVDSNELFDKFKEYMETIHKSSDDEQSAPEEQTRRRPTKSPKNEDSE